MKALKMVSIMILLFFGVKSNAQYTGVVNKFTVTQGSVLNTNSNTTTIRFSVSYLRYSDANVWRPFNMSVKLGISELPSGALTEYLSDEYTVNSTDFDPNLPLVEKNYEVTVNTSRLPLNYHLVLEYNVPNISNTSYLRYVGEAYKISLPAGPVTTNYGGLYRMPDQGVYSIMDGKARLIINPTVLKRLYDYSGKIINWSSMPSNVSIGQPIGNDAYLVRDSQDQKIYFYEGGSIRHITSVYVANKYHFKISSNNQMITINGTFGYVIGPPLTQQQ